MCLSSPATRYIAEAYSSPDGAGDVVLQLKSAWRDGTTHIVMSPLEFMQRLAALARRPRLYLIGFHGVLAPMPNCVLRSCRARQRTPASLNITWSSSSMKTTHCFGMPACAASFGRKMT